MSLDALVRKLVADEVERRLAVIRSDGDPADWIDQRRSPLGRKVHCALVRAGVLPGLKVHRRWLVRRRDLDAYILEHGVPAPKPAAPGRPDAGDAEARAFARVGARRVSG